MGILSTLARMILPLAFSHVNMSPKVRTSATIVSCMAYAVSAADLLLTSKNGISLQAAWRRNRRLKQQKAQAAEAKKNAEKAAEEVKRKAEEADKAWNEEKEKWTNKIASMEEEKILLQNT